jgi:hypothetical protein
MQLRPAVEDHHPPIRILDSIPSPSHDGAT